MGTTTIHSVNPLDLSTRRSWNGIQHFGWNCIISSFFDWEKKPSKANMDTKNLVFKESHPLSKHHVFMSMLVFGNLLYKPTFRSYDCISNNWIRGPPILGFRHQSCSDGFKVHMWNFACLGASSHRWELKSKDQNH